MSGMEEGHKTSVQSECCLSKFGSWTYSVCSLAFSDNRADLCAEMMKVLLLERWLRHLKVGGTDHEALVRCPVPAHHTGGHASVTCASLSGFPIGVRWERPAQVDKSGKLIRYPVVIDKEDHIERKKRQRQCQVEHIDIGPFPDGDADNERKNHDHVTRHRRQRCALDIAEREDDHDQGKEVIVQWQTPPA